MAHIFLHIYQWIAKSSTRLWLSLLLTVLFISYFASQVSFEEDISKMLPDDRENRGYQEAVNSTKILDKLIIRIELKDSTDEEAPKLYATEFFEKLSQRKDLKPLIREINFRVPDEQIQQVYDLVYRNIPYYLEEKDYARIDSMINPQGVARVLESSYHRLISPASIVLKSITMKDPLNISAMGLSKFQTLQTNGNFQLNDGYIYSKDLKNLYILVSHTYASNDTPKNQPLVEGIEEIIKDLNNKYMSKAQGQHFGAAAVALCNAKQIKKDIIITVNVALVLIILLLYLFYRNFSIPILVLSPAAFGMMFSLASIHFIKGKVSVLALGSGAVVLGIAIDYAFHIVTHYMHSRSIREVIEEVSTPLLIGSISTIGAFLSLLFVQSEILYDFGLFSGLSLIGAALFSLVFLPHLLVKAKLGAVSSSGNQSSFKLSWLERIIQIKPERSKLFVLLVVVLTVILAWFAGSVFFEDDLSKMNFMTEDLRKAENHFFETEQGKERNLYFIFKGKDLNSALANSERGAHKLDSLKNKGLISSYSNIGALLPSIEIQKQKLTRWNTFWTPQKIGLVEKLVEAEALKLGFKAQAFAQFYTFLKYPYTTFSDNDIHFLKKNILKEYVLEGADKVAVLATIRVPAGKDHHLVSLLNTNDESYLLDKQYFYNKLMLVVKDDFNQIQWTSSLLVFLILWLSFGRLELTLIAYVPMVISWFWILGIMGITDIRFNIVNIIISTFIFGIGDDYSIFFVDGLEKKYKEGKNNLQSYKNSVFLSSLTTLIGMGSLIFAQHPALKSIALVSVVGILCVLIISYTLIPFLYRITITKRTEKGLAPLTVSNVSRTIWVYFYFTLGSLILTAVAWVLLVLFRQKKNKSLIYGIRYVMMLYVRSLLWMVFVVKKRIINDAREDLTKPALVIANHQSFLDILLLIAFSPKILIITNSWVWNSPIFGKLVRLVGFYNADDGAEGSLDYVKEKMAEGYSIAIFPEGTRTEDGEIRRFHKGAFFLAEKLQLDIVPILLHGTGEGIRKGDLVLNRFPMTLKVLPRQNYDAKMERSYQDHAKEMTRYYRQEHQILKEHQQPEIFFYKILSGYIYKGPVLEWYFRIKVRLENFYHLFDELLPKQGKIIDIGCGYGFMAYFLAAKSENREILGLDYDHTKIDVANHHYLKTPQISFVAADATYFAYEDADAIVMMDILHYMPAELQISLIKKCIAALKPSGILLIRDGDSSQQKKHQLTQLTEFFSTRVMGFNIKKHGQLQFLSSAFLISALADQKVDIHIIDQTKYSSNIIYQIIKK